MTAPGAHRAQSRIERAEYTPSPRATPQVIQRAITAQAAAKPSVVEMLEIRPLEGSGNLKAFAKVRLGAVGVHSLRIIQQPGQAAWVSLPQQKVGEKYFAIVEITRKDLLDQVREAVLRAWEAQR